MAKKKSKFSLEKLVCAVLAIAGMVATIIGVFGDFLKSKVEYLLSAERRKVKLCTLLKIWLTVNLKCLTL